MAAKRRRQTLSNEHMTYWSYMMLLVDKTIQTFVTSKSFFTDNVRNVITSSTQQVNALTFLAGHFEKCSNAPVNIVALTPPNTGVAKSDVWIYFLHDPTFHLNHQNTKKCNTKNLNTDKCCQQPSIESN